MQVELPTWAYTAKCGSSRHPHRRHKSKFMERRFRIIKTSYGTFRINNICVPGVQLSRTLWLSRCYMDTTSITQTSSVMRKVYCHDKFGYHNSQATHHRRCSSQCFHCRAELLSVVAKKSCIRNKTQQLNHLILVIDKKICH